MSPVSRLFHRLMMRLAERSDREAEAADAEAGQVGPPCWGTEAEPHSPTKTKRAADHFVCPVCGREVGD